MASLAEIQRVEFQKIRLKVTFPSMKNSPWVVQSRIKVRYVPLLPENVLDTKRRIVRDIENLLLASEVKAIGHIKHFLFDKVLTPPLSRILDAASLNMKIFRNLLDSEVF